MARDSTLPVAHVTDVEDGSRPFEVENDGFAKKPSGRSKCALFCKCLSAFLFVAAVIIGVLVWQRVLWFEVPNADYVAEGSSVVLSGVGGAFEPTFTVKVAVKVTNPNNYPIYFKDVQLRVHDYDDSYVGTVKHVPTVKVAGKSTTIFDVQGEMTTSAAEVAGLATNCAANNMKTSAKAQGTVKAVLGGLSIPLKLGPYHTQVKCTIV